MSINEHDSAVIDFKWSNFDQSQGHASQSGIGFIISLSKDQTVKIFNIAKTEAECVFTLHHDCQISSLGLSPDNQLLAVGGQNSEIFIWSIKDQKMIRCFERLPNDPTQDVNMMGESITEITDINWSNDGTLVAAGCEKTLVMLDMKKILSQSVESLLQENKK
jgi:WD40 repeat protein